MRHGFLGLLLLLPPLGAPAGAQEEGVSAQETGTVFGRILDQDTFRPVVGVVVRISVGEDQFLQDISGSLGTFHVTGVPLGERVVVLEHIAYGEYAQHVVVEAGMDLRVDVHMSPRAIEFEPLVVEVLSDLERRRLTSGFNINEIPAEEIELAARGGMQLGDLLRGGMPGVRVRGGYRGGDYLCVEYRGSGAGACDEVSVYLDGVPVANPGLIYSSLALDDIDRVEVLSSLEATTRYGTRAAGGALLIESRDTRVGGDRDVSRISGPFDWSLEEAPHRWGKVFGSSALANAAGVGLGYLIANRCLEARRTNHGMSYTTRCSEFVTLTTGIVGLSLPAAVGGATASRMGSTERSRGRVLPAALAGFISTTAGYVVLMRAENRDSRSGRIAGGLVIALGTPLLVTLSDRLFRVLR